MPRIQSKRWTFTINNPGAYEPPHQGAAYIVWQTERGEQGTVHLQGYVRFNTRKELAAVKRFLNNDAAHLEGARGSEADNKKYCTKEDTRILGSNGEFGTFDDSIKGQGQRTDLEHCATMLREGKEMREVALAHPGDFIRYGTGLTNFALTIQPLPPVERQVEVSIYWGPTGTGKTHRIMTEHPEAFQVLPGRDPWDGYTSQSTIFLDEFSWEDWPINTMKLLLDKWRYRLQRRYHNAYAAWTQVFIACQDSPASWYPNSSAPDIAALRRRIKDSCRLITDRQQIPSLLPPNPQF